MNSWQSEWGWERHCTWLIPEGGNTLCPPASVRSYCRTGITRPWWEAVTPLANSTQSTRMNEPLNQTSTSCRLTCFCAWNTMEICDGSWERETKVTKKTTTSFIFEINWQKKKKFIILCKNINMEGYMHFIPLFSFLLISNFDVSVSVLTYLLWLRLRERER